jgi:hypothetical protein
LKWTCSPPACSASALAKIYQVSVIYRRWIAAKDDGVLRLSLPATPKLVAECFVDDFLLLDGVDLG